MGTLVTTEIQNGTPNDANDVNNNFTAVKAVVNGGIDDSNISPSAAIDPTKLDLPGSAAVFLDGTGAFSSPPAPSSNVPAGAVMDYAGASAPSGYLMCDGSAVSRTTYADLFTAIGTTYGAGDGSTTFNVPDVRGRVKVGVNSTGPALINGLGDNDGRTLANRNISHRHQMPGGTANNGGTEQQYSINSTRQSYYTTGDSNNTDYPAFIALNAIIKT